MNKIFISKINLKIILLQKVRIKIYQNYHYFKNYIKNRKIFHNMKILIDKINLL